MDSIIKDSIKGTSRSWGLSIKWLLVKCRLQRRPQQDCRVAIRDSCVFYVELGYLWYWRKKKEGRILQSINFLNVFFKKVFAWILLNSKQNVQKNVKPSVFIRILFWKELKNLYTRKVHVMVWEISAITAFIHLLHSYTFIGSLLIKYENATTEFNFT